MRLINQRAELYNQEEFTVEGILKQIERCTRVSYKSEDKITDSSAKAFVDRLIQSKHFAGLEQGTVYITMPLTDYNNLVDDHDFNFFLNPYTYFQSNPLNHEIYISTNYRVLLDYHYEDLLEYVSPPTKYHTKRYTFKFTTDIGVCRELLRHRKFSFVNESTRYCNYSKDKFGNEITFIIPSWSNLREDDLSEVSLKESIFIDNCKNSEINYLQLLDAGATPQEARQVLPLATKSELIMTGFADDWKYLFDVRLFGKTGKPHPDMKDLMENASSEAIKFGLWDEIYKKEKF